MRFLARGGALWRGETLGGGAPHRALPRTRRAAPLERGTRLRAVFARHGADNRFAVDLSVGVRFEEDATDRDFTFRFHHFETPNDGPTPDDEVDLPTRVSPESVTIDGEEYAVVITGFKQNGRIVNKFVSPENGANSAHIVAALSRVGAPDVVIADIRYKGAVKRTQADEYVEIVNRGTAPGDRLQLRRRNPLTSGPPRTRPGARARGRARSTGPYPYSAPSLGERQRCRRVTGTAAAAIGPGEGVSFRSGDGPRGLHHRTGIARPPRPRRPARAARHPSSGCAVRAGSRGKVSPRAGRGRPSRRACRSRRRRRGSGRGSSRSRRRG
ncbi:choice-of-anchor K domain-containing protein [Streptomyces sp. NPDC055107]